MHSTFNSLRMPSGHVLRNRFMLAPLTTQQSHSDGRVSSDDQEWLAMRAEGGFGLVITAAAAVTAKSRAFPGQYGTYSDKFNSGLSGLAAAVNRHGSISLVQLQHGGGRSLVSDGGEPIAPSATRLARAANLLDLAEVVEAFASGAERSVQAGFHGVQVHAAYGFLLAQFLDPSVNRRTDAYGGALANRARLIREVLSAIRARVPKALLSIRMNLRDRGLRPEEMIELAEDLLSDGSVDHLDLVVEGPTIAEELNANRPWLQKLPHGQGILSLTGGFSSARSIQIALDHGADLVGFGTAAVLHPDMPKQMLADPEFDGRSHPVTDEYLAAKGVAAPFLHYLKGLPGFVAPKISAAA